MYMHCTPLARIRCTTVIGSSNCVRFWTTENSSAPARTCIITLWASRGPGASTRHLTGSASELSCDGDSQSFHITSPALQCACAMHMLAAGLVHAVGHAADVAQNIAGRHVMIAWRQQQGMIYCKKPRSRWLRWCCPGAGPGAEVAAVRYWRPCSAAPVPALHCPALPWRWWA